MAFLVGRCLVVAALASCSGESDFVIPQNAMIPCTTVDDCRADPSYEPMDPPDAGVFRPECIFGMCQPRNSHRCVTDDDCRDLHSGLDPATCVDVLDSTHAPVLGLRLCRLPGGGGGGALGELFQCGACCYPRNDPDPSKYWCDGLLCRPWPAGTRYPCASEEGRPFSCAVGLP